MAKKITDEDLDLLDELGVDAGPTKSNSHSAREQRIMAGFEEIQRFVQEHGRLPQHGEDRDIFERLYAVRLECLRTVTECREIIKGHDSLHLLDSCDGLGGANLIRDDDAEYRVSTTTSSDLSDDDLLDALGAGDTDIGDITALKHVRAATEKRAAEEIAKRIACQNFEMFNPLFEQLKKNIKSGSVNVIECRDKTEMKQGDFFIIQGQMAYLAEAGEDFTDAEGRKDCRLRVIFDNGTESGMLRRSLQKRLWEDHTARRIIAGQDLGPLFSNTEEDGDLTAGYVYVLRSKSENPFIAENRKVVHKIGITIGSVKNRIANAAKDPTYLLAEVEIVEMYKISNLDLTKLEKLLHKFFDSARLDLQLKDRFGFDVAPREWFLAPLPVIQDAVHKLIEGTISDYCYDTESAQLMRR